MLTGYRITSAWKWGMNLLQHACIISTKTTTTKWRRLIMIVFVWEEIRKNGRGERILVIENSHDWIQPIPSTLWIDLGVPPPPSPLRRFLLLNLKLLWKLRCLQQTRVQKHKNWPSYWSFGYDWKKIKIFSKIRMLCKNFRSLANFEAIRPIIFLNGQQYHSIRY